MIRARTLGVLIGITVAVIAGIIATKDGNLPPPPTTGVRPGDKVFPQLSAQVNDITRLTVTTGAGKTTIAKQSDQWVLPDKANYPADIGKVRQVLLGMMDLKRLEPKTRNPELFSQLGLAGPTAGSEDSRSVELADQAGDVKAALMIGKEKPAPGTTRRSEYYVRIPSEDQAWLAEGSVLLPRNETEWLNTQLTNIELKRLAGLVIRHGDGETIRIEKASADAQDFAVVEPQQNEKVRSAFTVNNMAQSMAQLVLQDVVASDSNPLAEPLHFSAELTTFDGLKVKLDVAKSGEEFLARISAEKIATEESADAQFDTAKLDSTSQPTQPKADPIAEAKAIQEIGGKWHFKLSSFAVESIGKRAAELYELPPTPDESANITP